MYFFKKNVAKYNVKFIYFKFFNGDILPGSSFIRDPVPAQTKVSDNLYAVDCAAWPTSSGELVPPSYLSRVP